MQAEQPERRNIINTVSKIFNGRGAVPETTRDLVLSKARELGYYPFRDRDLPSSHPVGGNIALLTHSKPLSSNFGAQLITNFTDQICRSGFNLKMFEISGEEYARKTLPPHFSGQETAGILAIELFDRDYTRMVCDLGLPTLFIDSYAGAPEELMHCDLVYMENHASSIALTRRQIQAGAREIGFVGDISHCSSFRERWNGYRTAMDAAGLAVLRELCILADDTEPYGDPDWMKAQLDAMPHLPDGFVCANDYLAICVMRALQKRGVSIPKDVMITGFDGSPESAVITPALTTAEIPSAAIGRMSADLLLSRIRTPSLPYRCSLIRTTPIWRDSVRQPVESGK